MRTKPAPDGNQPHAVTRPTQAAGQAASGYVSEFEQFLAQYKAAHPDIEEDQRRGWHIWWDHKADPSDAEVRRKDALPVKPSTKD